MRLRCPLLRRLATAALILALVALWPASPMADRGHAGWGPRGELLWFQAPGAVTGVFVSGALATSCTTTLSVGANIATAISAAAGGAVICLNTGNYGTLTTAAVKTSAVTIMSVSGTGARFTSIDASGSNRLRFDHLSIDYFLSGNSSTANLTISNSVASGNALWEINCSGMSAPGHNFLIDGNTFTNSYAATSGHEGRLDFFGGNAQPASCGAVVRNNHFEVASPSSCSDGIQIDANLITVGPGNVFLNILEGSCSAHADGVQFLGADDITLVGNYFKIVDTMIMSPDGCGNAIIRNNVFDGSGSGNNFNIQFGSCSNFLFEHNTLFNVSPSFDAKSGGSVSSGTFQNNIVTGDGDIKTQGNNLPRNDCNPCTFRFSLYDDSGSGLGTNNIVGTPSYVGGGTAPTTWAGWQLNAGSPGKAAGNDGNDMGSRCYGVGVGTCN